MLITILKKESSFFFLLIGSGEYFDPTAECLFLFLKGSRIWNIL